MVRPRWGLMAIGFERIYRMYWSASLDRILYGAIRRIGITLFINFFPQIAQIARIGHRNYLFVVVCDICGEFTKKINFYEYKKQ